MGFFEWIVYDESSFPTRLGILKRWSGIATALRLASMRNRGSRLSGKDALPIGTCQW